MVTGERGGADHPHPHPHHHRPPASGWRVWMELAVALCEAERLHEKLYALTVVEPSPSGPDPIWSLPPVFTP
ncbi:MAG: hypothetical protein VKN56_11190, partial [Cyanobacteriota bacterium]|nr:hypothetical protein [Cyanobacteriota bacterium]